MLTCVNKIHGTHSQIDHTAVFHRNSEKRKSSECVVIISKRVDSPLISFKIKTNFCMPNTQNGWYYSPK